MNAPPFVEAVKYVPPEKGIDPLVALANSALAGLRAAAVKVTHPEVLCRGTARTHWRAHYPSIDQANAGVLDALSRRDGIYAIFVGDPDGPWVLKYIGQTNADGARQRIRSHVVWRNKETPSGRSTGSKFDEVCEAVSTCKHVGLSFVAIEPGSLRHYVEAVLIRRFRPPWNSHGASHRHATADADDCTCPRLPPHGELVVSEVALAGVAP